MNKRLTILLVFLPALVVGFSARSQSVVPETTVVYLVRHAEKDLTDPAAKDPELTAAGTVRAQHLTEKLRTAPISAIYSTPFIRTRHTAQPLSGQKKVPITPYQAYDYKAIQEIIARQRGNTILLVGHSDNLLPIIRLAGATPPLDSIPASQYDNLFKLVILPGGAAQATVEKFK